VSEYDDKTKIGKRESRVRLYERRNIEDLGFVMSTPEGRRFLNRILVDCGIFRISYAGGARNEDTFFNEGMRNVGLKIFKEIDSHFPKEWLMMRQEAMNEEEVKNG